MYMRVGKDVQAMIDEFLHNMRLADVVAEIKARLDASVLHSYDVDFITHVMTDNRGGSRTCFCYDIVIASLATVEWTEMSNASVLKHLLRGV